MTWEEADYYPSTPGKQQALYKNFQFKDFATALAFVNKIGTIAEDMNHHPDISLAWGSVTVWLTSHDVHKITERDHDVAKKIDWVYKIRSSETKD